MRGRSPHVPLKAMVRFTARAAFVAFASGSFLLGGAAAAELLEATVERLRQREAALEDTVSQLQAQLLSSQATILARLDAIESKLGTAHGDDAKRSTEHSPAYEEQQQHRELVATTSSKTNSTRIGQSSILTHTAKITNLYVDTLFWHGVVWSPNDPTMAPTTSPSSAPTPQPSWSWTWTDATYLNDWTTYGPDVNPPARYTMDIFGFVRLGGLVRGGSIGSNIFQLPVAYRPDVRMLLSSEAYNNINSRIDVLTDGNVEMDGTSNVWVSLAGLTFAPATFSQWVYPSYTSGFSRYSMTFATIRYTKDAAGIVHLDGLVTGGGTGSCIFNLPDGFRPDARQLFATERYDTGSSVFGRADVIADGCVQMHLGSTSWFSLSGLTFASAGIAASWIYPTFANGWTNYANSYSSGRYMKDAGGIVHLDGLLCGGSGPRIFTLPPGYRPDKNLIFDTATNPNANGQATVYTDGAVHMFAGDSGWFSLSGLSFLTHDSV